MAKTSQMACTSQWLHYMLHHAHTNLLALSSPDLNFVWPHEVVAVRVDVSHPSPRVDGAEREGDIVGGRDGGIRRSADEDAGAHLDGGGRGGHDRSKLRS